MSIPCAFLQNYSNVDIKFLSFYLPLNKIVPKIELLLPFLALNKELIAMRTNQQGSGIKQQIFGPDRMPNLFDSQSRLIFFAWQFTLYLKA
jgi:hypothetical protein